MSSNPAFHPRFSVRNSFDQNLVDVSSGRYASEAGRQLQKQPKTKNCYDTTSKPVVMAQSRPMRNVRAARPNVQARQNQNSDRRDVTPKQPSRQDRQYWQSKDLVARPAQSKTQPQPVQISFEVEKRRHLEPYDTKRRPKAVEQTPSQVNRSHWKSNTRVDAPPAVQGCQSCKKKRNPRKPVEAMNHEQAKRMGQREGQLQRQLRGLGASQKFTVAAETKRETPNNIRFVVDPPREFSVQSNPLPSHMGVDTADDYRGHKIKKDESAVQRRQYWQGKNVVAQDAPAPSRFLPKNN